MATAPSRHKPWLPLRQTAPVVVLLLGDVLLWLIVSLQESNPAILAVHLLLLLPLAALPLTLDRSLALPCTVALALRSLFTTLAWYTAFIPERRFYIGTNSDASRFWEAASLTYGQASLAFFEIGAE